MKRLTGISIALLALFAVAAVATPGKTVFVQFIRGTDQMCTGPNCREIGPKLSRKLSPVFRWKHFWEIDRKQLTVQAKNVTRIELPGDRKLELQLTKGDVIEVRLFRRSGLVTQAKYPVSGEMCVLGGEDSNNESFFVVVRHDQPVNE